MQYLPRLLPLQEEASKKSIFLFGPRQTGKTTLLRRLFTESPYYNLLHSDIFFRLSARPSLLREELHNHSDINRPVIIDEIQKLPVLLDEVHALIEENMIKFILTGSSPRKLRRGGYNLLGGRARTRYLHPLVYPELPQFELLKVLRYGTIPSIYFSEEPEEDLRAYCGTYLKEEIQAEGAVRKIENFSRFLETAAFSSAELVNYENIANDSAVPARTIREYFTVLEDTLIAKVIEPYKGGKKRKPVSTGKLYFFDTGVSNILSGRYVEKPKSEAFGKALEQYIYTEIAAYLSYRKDPRKCTFWRTTGGHEVDFVIGDDTAVEVKGSENISERHCKSLLYLAEEAPLKHIIVVSMVEQTRTLGTVSVLPVEKFLSNLWNDFYTI